MKAKIYPVAIALLLTAGMAPGEVHFTVGPTFGVTLGGVTEQAAPVYGGQAAAHFENGISVELAAMTFTDKPEEERHGTTVTADQDITPVQLSLRLARPLIANRLRAFARVGLGWYFGEKSDVAFKGPAAPGYVVQTGPMEADRNDAFGYHWGVGLEWSFTDRLSALLEYRYGIMDSDADLSGIEGLHTEGDEDVRDFEDDFHDNNELGLLRVALNWRF